MTERFKNAYDALVKGFFQGTLIAGNCRACAVGNIIANSIGFKLEPSHLKEHGILPNTFWVDPVRVFQGAGKIHQDWGSCSEGEMIKISGYNFSELLKIEDAFESYSLIKCDEMNNSTEQEILEDQFKGLCAVVGVLLELDGISPDEKYNAKFREHPKLVLA